MNGEAVFGGFAWASSRDDRGWDRHPGSCGAVGKSSISRFLHHLKLPFKKSCGQPSRIARTWPPPEGRCSGDRGSSIRESSYSSMKPAFRRRLHVCTAEHRRANGSSKKCCTETGRPLHSSRHCVTAPFVLGAKSSETFKVYVKQFLAPPLKKDDIVFMDNASVHMVEGVEEAIEARGAILFYLPAYSPDLNPIEQFFAKLKCMLRKISAYSLKQAAYTVDSLCAALASSLTKISRSECAAYLANSGYGQSYRETL